MLSLCDAQVVRHSPIVTIARPPVAGVAPRGSGPAVGVAVTIHLVARHGGLGAPHWATDHSLAHTVTTH